MSLTLRRWELLFGTVQGVGKRKNQDWYAADGTGTDADPVVLAVADGHGSAVHARSDLGARFAVDQFVALATAFARTAVGCQGPEQLRLMNHARNEFPRTLVHEWRTKVLRHWQEHRPPADDGLPEPPDQDKVVAYGTTLIGAIVLPWLFVAWQIGDGDLAVVGHDGTVSRPLAPVEEVLGDETESLCGKEAWRAVRTHWAPHFEESRRPRLVALSTDGLSKSFASGDGFRAFVEGLDARLADDGTDSVREALPGWLTQASRHSGDDTTIAAALRTASTATDTTASTTETET